MIFFSIRLTPRFFCLITTCVRGKKCSAFARCQEGDGFDSKPKNTLKVVPTTAMSDARH